MTARTGAVPRDCTAAALAADPGLHQPLPPDLFEAWRERAAASESPGEQQFTESGPGRAWIAALAERLRRGPGVAIVPAPGGELPPASGRRLFAAVGRALGRPLGAYGELYEVRDRGGDYRTSAIPVSQTAAGTGMHTDSSAVDVLPDFVGLFCEEPATAGGDSLAASAHRARAVLAEAAPAALERLEQTFVRDIVTPGMLRTRENLLRNRFPVFSSRPRGGAPELCFRYMRYWIERGQAEAGEPLAAPELAALDRLDAALNDPEHAFRFRLERGDQVWFDNRSVAHGRTAYQDGPGTERRLLRMWIADRRA